jgi:sugar lactone lactonase YvrE
VPVWYTRLVIRKGAFVGVVAILAAAVVQLPATKSSADGDGPKLVAGTGAAGASGDGGPATQAQLHGPLGIAAAQSGAVYIADTGNHTVRVIAPGGTISTVAGTGRENSAAANSGRVDPADVTVSAGTKGTAFNLADPAGIALGKDGTLYIADIGLYRVFALAPDGLLSVFAGTGNRAQPSTATGDGGPATAATLGHPGGIAVAPNGTVYIGDLDHHLIRAVAPSGVITTVAGNGDATLAVAGGQATRIPIGDPDRIAVDSQGVLWLIADQTLLRVADGAVATATMSGSGADGTWSLTRDGAAVQSSNNSLVGVAVSGTTVYALDGRDQSVRRLSSGSRCDTTATGIHSITGPIAASGPSAVYLVDSSNSRVYALTLPPARSGGTTTGTPWWPIAVGGAVVIVLLVGGLLVVRRRVR